METSYKYLKKNGNGNLLNFNKVAGFCHGSCSTFAIHQALPGFSLLWRVYWCGEAPGDVEVGGV